MGLVRPGQHGEMHGLYCDHHRWLESWLRRKLGDASDAADLAHDTFTRILVSRKAIAIEQPRAYLTTVAKGILANWCRRQALERAYLDALAVLPEPLSPSPEESAIILETLHTIDTLLDTLPPLVKRAFLLSQVDGLKYEEIAGHIGVSLVTVKRYMKQAFVHCLSLAPDVSP
ncbi:sigma-70 family RNA polymerase sigma factor [Paraburkholderia tropica]|uniref:sigma-70 family RNA polymerase sigma factor n=1 Tax=Paraburkholderia tropica TaxID=92647 RepID=UPI0038BC8A27